jgi:hypothetical protein
MDESIREIQKYIDNLIPVLKTAVLSPEWRKRVKEIGQKYTLTPDQISSLEYEVLFVLIGMEPEEDLVANIQKEVSVSSIIAEQISEDVSTRIFQYILKMVESKNEVKDTVSTPTTQTPHSTPLLSEIENMADESNQTPHQKEVAPPMNLPGAEEENGSTNNELRITSQIEKNIPNSTVIHNSNFELRTTPSFANTKLNSTVTSTQQTVVKRDVVAETPTPIVHGYTADPYREAIE